MEEELDALWADAFPLPEAIVEEVRRVAERVEVRFECTPAKDLPAAALAESPIYRGGEQLQPWQRAFVALFLRHREAYGKVRLLLADEVGLGKILSLAASAMAAALLDDGPVLILCPSTLTLQWQVELQDKLGIPSALWSSTKKVWIDPKGHVVKTRGPEDIARCPFRIAIVSTGLVFHGSEERTFLLERRYGTVVLDEAHKARRRGGLDQERQEANNLLDFMLRIGVRTRHVLLGTATPIQTEVHELWDLLAILNTGADFVLGREPFARWVGWERALPIVKGARSRPTFDLAYEAALAFTDASKKRYKAGGFMKTLLLQRICSSFFSGRATAERLLRREPPEDPLEDEEESRLIEEAVSDLTGEEADHPKAAVKDRRVRLVLATDAACEGLNLQTLGTLINVDLPWNPSRLEQRLGRIKRFGQARRNVDMLNLVYTDTQDEQVYRVLSRRMKDRYDIFGGLPDTIEDDWIDSVERLEAMMDEYIRLRRKARDVFELRYQTTIDPNRDRWERCARVLSRRDVIERLSAPW